MAEAGAGGQDRGGWALRLAAGAMLPTCFSHLGPARPSLVLTNMIAHGSSHVRLPYPRWRLCDGESLCPLTVTGADQEGPLVYP